MISHLNPLNQENQGVDIAFSQGKHRLHQDSKLR